jgi:CBS domain-containing protein
MRVEQLMARQVQSCTPQDSLGRAAQLMWEHDCGCLPVLASPFSMRVVGVITDRDICMAALFKDRPLHELTVADTMSGRVHSCRPADSLLDAEQAMRAAHVRRLPVVDAEGALVGMLALADLAREASRENTLPTRQIAESEVNETLAAICEPPQYS